ncbi:MAG: phage holin family protein [Rhodoglobus sp.]
MRERPEASKRSLFSLVSSLPTLVTDLVRAEIESVKNEVTQRLKNAGIGVGLLLGAGMFLFFALLALLAAAILGLATVLPAWAAALIVGVGIVLIAGILAAVGINALKNGFSASQSRTIDNLKEDVRTIKGLEKKTSIDKKVSS